MRLYVSYWWNTFKVAYLNQFYTLASLLTDEVDSWRESVNCLDSFSSFKVVCMCSNINIPLWKACWIVENSKIQCLSRFFGSYTHIQCYNGLSSYLQLRTACYFVTLLWLNQTMGKAKISGSEGIAFGEPFSQPMSWCCCFCVSFSISFFLLFLIIWLWASLMSQLTSDIELLHRLILTFYLHNINIFSFINKQV
jgi:hypothetical protein